MTSELYNRLVRDVSAGYENSDLEVKIVVTIRGSGEILHRVTEFMTHSEDDVLTQALGTALKLSSGTLDVDTEE